MAYFDSSPAPAARPPAIAQPMPAPRDSRHSASSATLQLASSGTSVEISSDEKPIPGNVR